MVCMKCGRKREEGQSFCNDCLAVMEKFPIAAGTLVHLPRRQALPAPKKNVRRRVLTAEEQVIKLRRNLRWVTGLLVLTLMLLGGAVYLYYTHLCETEGDKTVIGQNYSVDTSVTTTGDNVSRETLLPAADTDQ